MRSASLFAILALAAAPSVIAGPCVPDLLSNYIALGATGCQNGSFNVVDFNFSVISSTVVILASDVNVTPNSGPNSFGLNFTSAKFNIAFPDSAKYLLTYTWDPGDLRSLEDIMNSNTPVAPGSATITTDTCPDAAFVGATCVNPIQTITVSHDGITPNLIASTIYNPSVGTLGIRDTIFLDASTGGSSEITGFQNVAFVPEPSTLGIGLLSLGAVICRSRLNRRERGL
jgi:hypothetical protein